MRDKRTEPIQKQMRIFEVVCFCLASLYALCTVISYFTLSVAKVDIPVQLQASFVAVLIILCALWLWFCVISPVSDWLKERRKRKINAKEHKENE